MGGKMPQVNASTAGGSYATYGGGLSRLMNIDGFTSNPILFSVPASIGGTSCQRRPGPPHGRGGSQVVEDGYDARPRPRRDPHDRRRPPPASLGSAPGRDRPTP